MIVALFVLAFIFAGLATLIGIARVNDALRPAPTTFVALAGIFLFGAIILEGVQALA